LTTFKQILSIRSHKGLYTIFSFKTNLKVLKAQPDAVNGRTDNTMTKRKVTKGQTIIYQTLPIRYVCVIDDNVVVTVWSFVPQF
jgi:hypothetical protein